MPTYTFETTCVSACGTAPRRRSLIRCEWCGMSYDGDEHENCPHCLAPRPTGDDGAVFCSDGVPYAWL